jgi:pimeloyl-[acyl-carrier protein] methyl ester esterase
VIRENTEQIAAANVVLLHGWGMSSAVWGELPASLGDSRRIVPIELPGHGAAPFAAGRRTLADWAAACLEDAPERAAWLGWSLGGLVVLEAALSAPERVCGLILLTATPRFVRAPDWPAAMPAEILAQFKDALLADPWGTLERFLALQVRASEGAREILRRLRREITRRPAAKPEALAAGLDLLREGDLRERLSALRCPTLWLFGARDTLVPATAAEAVSRLLPRARLRLIAGAGHAPHLSHAAPTVKEIRAFLTELAC